jgi:hypothetical protein
MRFSRLVLSCSVVGSLLMAPMASPASAADASVASCSSQYLNWVAGNVPNVDVDIDDVLAYWNTTWAYINCELAGADDLPDEIVACIEATPGYQNLWGGAPLLRYADTGVNLLGGHFSVYPFNLAADASAIVACFV